MATKTQNEQSDVQMETSTKNKKGATKSQNEQPKTFACFGFRERTGSKSDERQMETLAKNQNEQQKATEIIFHSNLYSIASILDIWKVVDIKSNEKPESNNGQQKTAKSYEEQYVAETDNGAGKSKTGKMSKKRNGSQA